MPDIGKFYTLIAAIGENRNRRTRHTWRSSPIAVYNRYVCHRLNNGDRVSPSKGTFPDIAELS